VYWEARMKSLSFVIVAFFWVGFFVL